MAKTQIYPGYSGKKRWLVYHPRHKRPIAVLAPTAQAAMVAAAGGWGERWQSVEFYSNVNVTSA
nr:MAG TPA: hypothetical protein [Caudoviricetes sp.]